MFKKKQKTAAGTDSDEQKAVVGSGGSRFRFQKLRLPGRVNKKFALVAVLVLAGGIVAVFAASYVQNDSDKTKTDDFSKTEEVDSFTAAIEDIDEAVAAGRVDEALDAYDKGIASSGNETEEVTLVLLKAYLLLDNKRYDEALTIAQDADKRWQRPDTAVLLGDVLAAQGNKADAAQQYRTAIDRFDTDDPEYATSKALYESKIEEL